MSRRQQRAKALPLVVDHSFAQIVRTQGSTEQMALEMITTAFDEQAHLFFALYAFTNHAHPELFTQTHDGHNIALAVRDTVNVSTNDLSTFTLSKRNRSQGSRNNLSEFVKAPNLCCLWDRKPIGPFCM